MKPCKLVGTIISVKGHCSAGHTVGEQHELSLWSQYTDAARRAPNLCAFFYDMTFPYLAVLQFGGEFPWQENKDTFQISCPDTTNQVTIEIKRIKK